MSNDINATPDDGEFAVPNARQLLAPFMRPTIEAKRSDLTRQIRWARELLADCESAIAAQQRIIEHDGALDLHQISLKNLQREKRKLEAEVAALEASDPDRPK